MRFPALALALICANVGAQVGGDWYERGWHGNVQNSEGYTVGRVWEMFEDGHRAAGMAVFDLPGYLLIDVRRKGKFFEGRYWHWSLPIYLPMKLTLCPRSDLEEAWAVFEIEVSPGRFHRLTGLLRRRA